MTAKEILLLETVHEGQYIIMLTYPSYADYIDKLSVISNENNLLGKIMLTMKSKIPEAV